MGGGRGLQWGRNLSVAEGSDVSALLLLELEASMGPQPFGCGRAAATAQVKITSPGFNGAATFRLRKVAAQAGQAAKHVASMGPQPFGCGRLNQDSGLPVIQGASMGPQPFGCGRSPKPCRLAVLRHRFNGAATFRLRKALSLAFIGGARYASMGPQPFGCGRVKVGAQVGGPVGFNGAATFRLRKVGKHGNR